MHKVVENKPSELCITPTRIKLQDICIHDYRKCSLLQNQTQPPNMRLTQRYLNHLFMS